jgi:hypothetical protein
MILNNKMFEEYINKNTNNEEYIKLYYHSSDDIFYPIHIYKTKYIIPQNTTIRYNKVNKNFIKHLIKWNYLEAIVDKVTYIFTRDYELSNELLLTSNQENSMLILYTKILGYNDSFPTRFVAKKMLYYNLFLFNTETELNIIKRMDKNKVPKIYMKYIKTLSQLHLGSFVKIFLEVNDYDFDINKINELLTFYYTWLPDYHWDLGCFWEIVDLLDIKKDNEKIEHMYKKGLIILEHKKKLLKLLRRNENYYIQMIFKLLDKKARYNNIYQIYKIIEDIEDDLLSENKCCIIQ